MKSETYKSKIDLWLIALVFGSAFFAIGLGITLRSVEPLRGFIPIGIGVFVVLVSVLVMFPCRYTLGTDHLHIRCGIFRQSIPYSEIGSVELSSSFVSAPALSLHRVKVNFGGSSQLVSPIDREGFMKLLRERADQAKSRYKSRGRSNE